MSLDLDTFLVTVYCQIDDLYQAHFAGHKPRRPGPAVHLSDSEVLCLMVLAQWEAHRSERAFLRYVRQHWSSYFPRLLSQSAFNRRARDLWGVLCQLAPTLAQSWTLPASECETYAVLDGVAVPLMRCCRGRQHRLFAGEANLGRGGSDKAWYYGIKLLSVVSPQRGITGFVYGPANTEERWLAEALFRWRADAYATAPTAAQLARVLGPAHRRHGQRYGPSGPLCAPLAVGAHTTLPYVADLGFEGQAWMRHWREHYGARVLTQAAYASAQGRRWLSGLRQCVETTFAALTSTFGLTFPRARTSWGLLTRIAAKIAAFNLALYINHCFDRAALAFFNPLA